jgi:hypothetical protein
VRKHRPELILWAVFGIAAAPLPGQIFVINDSIFQQHLFWPIFLALFVPFDWKRAPLLAILALFQFAHPIGMALFGGAAICAIVANRLDPPRSRQYLIGAGICILLAALVLLRLKLVPDTYAQREFSWANALDRWKNGVAGAPILGLSFVYAAAMLLFIQRKLHPPARRFPLGPIAIACLLIASLIWIRWASDVSSWHLALDYRRWLVPLAAPFYALACLDAALGRATNNEMRNASTLEPWSAAILTSIFAIVLILQSRGWSQLQNRLLRQLDQHPTPILAASRLDWTAQTPLRHWGISTLSFFLQGRQPEKAILSDLGTQLFHESPPRVAYADDDIKDPAPGPSGWFDFRPLINAARLPAVQRPPAPAARPAQTSPSAHPPDESPSQKSPDS